MDKDKKILVLVESPNKVATLKKILKDGGYKNVTVMASVGHITRIKDGGSYWNSGIEPTKDFAINYAIADDKKDVVKGLKKAVSEAEQVFICSDPDREGECIAWHLKTQLKIPDKKYARATFHEVTKAAVLAALESPRKIDQDLVDAAKARAVVDKMCGYRLSPIARDAVLARSVGRCQSAGLKMIVEREKEIQNFVPEKYFDLFLHFVKNKSEFKAKYVGTEDAPVKKITDMAIIDAIKADCDGKPYLVDSVDKREVKESPKPPFTTSTFQQEANRVYGMSVDSAMRNAQRLFEGINIGGEHVALITYIRTDDCSMAPEFAEDLGKYVIEQYGKQYYAPVKKPTKKGELAQEAHECLRVINLQMSPARLSTYIKDQYLLKVYRLIWERTIMSSMAPAIIGDTSYNIKNGKHVFNMHSREIIFDGYRRAHVDTTAATEESVFGEDAVVDDAVRETFSKDEELQNTSLQEEHKETTPPKRYSEATFIRELDKRGIGRPSTFATILKTLLAENRGYCFVKDKVITPTARGMELSQFLDKSFPDLINFNYTKELESNLDKIANGTLKQLDFLNDFYRTLEDSAQRVRPETKVCPHCGKPLVKRFSKYGAFFGCSGYPDCKYIEKSGFARTNNAAQPTEE